MEGAFSIFRSIEAEGGEISRSIYNAVLDVCVECGDLSRAGAWMQRMHKDGAVDLISFNTMIKARLRHEQFDQARALMGEMNKAGFPPNCVTYNELINAL